MCSDWESNPPPLVHRWHSNQLCHTSQGNILHFWWLSRLMKDLTTYKFQTITHNHYKRIKKPTGKNVCNVEDSNRVSSLNTGAFWVLVPVEPSPNLITEQSWLIILQALVWTVPPKTFLDPHQSGSYCVTPLVWAPGTAALCSPHPWFLEYLAHSWYSVHTMDWTEKRYRKLFLK